MLADRPCIVLDALLVRSQPTGVGRSILELTQALAAADRGFDFTVLATHPELFADLGDAPGWTVRFCPRARGGTVAKAVYTQFVLPGLVRSLGAVLLHSLHFVGPLRPPCASVVTVYDLGYMHFPETVERTRRTYYRLLVPPTLRRAGAIVTCSEATAVDVAESFPAVAARVTTTPFGTPSWAVHRFAGLPPTPRPDDAPFLFVGTLEPRKNLARLLAAYERLLRRDDWRGSGAIPDLELVGAKGWNDSEIQHKLQGLLESGKVRVVDYLDADRLADRFATARALLFPSLHEGFGFPILEAMAAGTPVLTSDRSSMAEVAGDAALLVDPTSEEAIAAGLARLICEPDLLVDLAARGKRRVDRWNWQHTAEVTVAVYRRLLKYDRSGDNND